MPKNKIVSVLRVSSSRQDIESQKISVLEYANEEGLRIDRFIEQVESTTKARQKKFIDEELGKLKKGDMLLISELTRLGRTTGELLVLVDNLVNRGVGIIILKPFFLKTTDPNDMASKFMLIDIAKWAEFERLLIKQRSEDGQKRAWKSGKRRGRPKGSKGKSKLDGKEKEIASMLSKRMSKASIARYFEVSYNTMHNFIVSRKLIS